VSGIQFRRYELKPGAHDDFLAWYEQIVPIRVRCGFHLLFALDLEEIEEFVSAWAYTGDLNQIEHLYYTDPDRTRLGRLARQWAERDASNLTGEARRTTVAAHPGFTRATSITSARELRMGYSGTTPRPVLP
jgi:hypothetical protein